MARAGTAERVPPRRGEPAGLRLPPLPLSGLLVNIKLSLRQTLKITKPSSRSHVIMCTAPCLRHCAIKLHLALMRSPPPPPRPPHSPHGEGVYFHHCHGHPKSISNNIYNNYLLKVQKCYYTNKFIHEHEATTVNKLFVKTHLN